MTLLDKALAFVSPLAALKRVHARHVLARYEAATPSRTRKVTRDNSTSEVQVSRDAATVRAVARSMERDHDLVRGALTKLTTFVVGPSGIGIEPQPRTADDTIHDDTARALLNLWRDWCRRPEVTHTLGWQKVQRLACRHWLRDGEFFAQVIEGPNPTLDHGTQVPLSLELLEADMCPLDYVRDTPVIEAGIERNAWGRPLAYYLWKTHPGAGRATLSDTALKRVPADRILAVAIRDRFSGLRGISQLASAIRRIEDIKDYEDSERIAARIAAAIAAYVKRDKDMEWSPPVEDEGASPAKLRLAAGTVFEKLAPGESIEMLNPNRPNSALEAFRDSQLRAVASGISLSFSSLSGNYRGTYSSQRQELVESWLLYQELTADFVAQFVQPVWERFVRTAVAAGLVKVPREVRAETIAQAEFRGPAMPWINPLHEADALRVMARSGFRSAQSIISERGGRVQDVYEQLARERRLAQELGLVLESDARYTSGAGVTQARPDGSAFPDPDGASAAALQDPST